MPQAHICKSGSAGGDDQKKALDTHGLTNIPSALLKFAPSDFNFPGRG
jgi:hypothetical protein